jgi:hypothetical protein
MTDQPQPEHCDIENQCTHFCVYKGRYCPVYLRISRPHTPAPAIERRFTLQEMIRSEKECEERVLHEREQAARTATLEVTDLLKLVSDGLNNNAVNDEDYGRWMSRFISQGCMCQGSQLNSKGFTPICDFSCVTKKLEDDKGTMEKVCEKMQSLRRTAQEQS